ncbi:MAG: glycosyltransferase [Planctomycetota bacterium]
MSDPAASRRTLAVITSSSFPETRVRAVRWTQLARELPAFGWRVVLLSRYQGVSASREQIDNGVHPSAEIEYIDRRPDAQPKPGERQRQAAPVSRSRKAISRSASVLYPPDPSVRAWHRTKPRILDALGRYRPDAVLAGFPTGGNVSLVPWLSRAQPAPVIADFEDPFTIDWRFRPKGLARLRSRAFQAIERDVHRSASLVLHAIPIHHRWARLAYPDARGAFRLLMMATPDAVLDGRVDPVPDPSGRPAVRVVGAMDGPAMLRLAQAIEAVNARTGPFRLDLVGTPPATADEIRSLLGESVGVHGRVPHERAIGFIAGASVLVNSLGPRRGRGLGLSSKLLEFMAAGKPIIQINPTRSDRLFARRRHGIRTLVAPSTADLAAAIETAYAEHSEADAERMRAAVRHETWHDRARQLAGWLDSVVEGREIKP